MRSLGELVLVFGMADNLSRLAPFSFGDEFTLFKGEGLEVLAIDVELSTLVAYVVVLDVLVLLLFLGFGHEGGLFEGRLIGQTLPSQHKLRVWSQFLHHQLAFLSQNCSSSLDAHFEDVQVKATVICDAPADHHFE